MSYNGLYNPLAASQNIHGRWGRVFRNGDWIANATEVTYSVEIDRQEVRRSGTRWVDYKEGEITGSGSLTIDYVDSQWTKEFIQYINGRNIDGTPLINKVLPVWTLQVNLEDAAIVGIEFDANGNAIGGHESVTLRGVKFWNLEGGYGTDMVGRSIEFTFNGISLDHEIVLPPDVNA